MALPSETRSFDERRLTTHAVTRLFVATMAFGYVRLLIGGLDLVIAMTVDPGGRPPLSFSRYLEVGETWSYLFVATGLLGVGLRAALIGFAIHRRREPLKVHPGVPFVIGLGGILASVAASGVSILGTAFLARLAGC